MKGNSDRGQTNIELLFVEQSVELLQHWNERLSNIALCNQSVAHFVCPMYCERQ